MCVTETIIVAIKNWGQLSEGSERKEKFIVGLFTFQENESEEGKLNLPAMLLEC